jgi:glycosyltransferase involved in cell wall biosynthesis
MALLTKPCNLRLWFVLVTPISAFIITRNEEALLAATIGALQPWVDDILVVDSGSTDRTVEIARGMGARVMHRIWTGYGPQKRFAEQNCKNDWVLNVDADEVITPALAQEINRLFATGRPPSPSAYRMRILTVYPGDTEPRRGAKDYNVVRLYHRSVGSYRDHPLHDRVVITGGTLRQLQAPAFHFSFTSLEHIVGKGNSFSSFSAQHTPERRARGLKRRLVVEFPLAFLKYYVLRRHYSGGWKGFYFALCQAFMRTTRIAKMLERVALKEAERRNPSAPPPAIKPVRHYSRSLPR